MKGHRLTLSPASGVGSTGELGPETQSGPMQIHKVTPVRKHGLTGAILLAPGLVTIPMHHLVVFWIINVCSDVPGACQPGCESRQTAPQRSTTSNRQGGSQPGSATIGNAPDASFGPRTSSYRLAARSMPFRSTIRVEACTLLILGFTPLRSASGEPARSMQRRRRCTHRSLPRETGAQERGATSARRLVRWSCSIAVARSNGV